MSERVRLSEAAHDLCRSVLLEPSAASQPAIQQAITAVRDAIAAPTPERLPRALIELSAHLMEGLPNKHLRRSMGVLNDACARCSSIEQQAALFAAAAPLWTTGLSHPNRHVRQSTLTLLAHLCVACSSEFPPTALECVLDCGVPSHLAALLETSTTPAQTLPVIVALRGLLRTPYAASQCRQHTNLIAMLQQLPAATRQGAVGAATSEY
jgi:hypothetical protein